MRSASPIWAVLHQPGFLLNTPAHVVLVAYPLIPWIGVTEVGYGLGAIYSWSAARRRVLLIRLVLALTLAVLALRALNTYGDPSRWTHHDTPAYTVLSFLNTTKYPPSLLFILMTLGPALLFLRAVDGATPRALRPAIIFGRVPLFYYIVHFPLIHLLALATCVARYGSGHWMFESPDLGHYPFTAPPGWGYSLPIVYLVWAVVVCAMYTLPVDGSTTWLPEMPSLLVTQFRASPAQPVARPFRFVTGAKWMPSWETVSTSWLPPLGSAVSTAS